MHHFFLTLFTKIQINNQTFTTSEIETLKNIAKNKVDNDLNSDKIQLNEEDFFKEEQLVSEKIF